MTPLAAHIVAEHPQQPDRHPADTTGCDENFLEQWHQSEHSHPSSWVNHAHDELTARRYQLPVLPIPGQRKARQCD